MALDTALENNTLITQRFLLQLRQDGFDGDIHLDAAQRLVHATDNSVYQILPQAVIAPKTIKALKHAIQLGARDAFRDVSFMARGGGTGTNGQALNDCIVVDTSRYLNKIIKINYAEEWVEVQPGVVLETLNRELADKGYFFPPHISPSKSATLGGMVATDACGKGSRIYGKTGDYVLSMDVILPSGKEVNTATYSDDALTALLLEDRAAYLLDCPDLPRGMSAYDLERALSEKNQLDFKRLIIGSEGSLGIATAIKFKIIRKPAHKILFAVSYSSFDAALRHLPPLIKLNPSAIETIDDRILSLAQRDILWHSVSPLLPDNKKAVEAIHFIEFETDDETALHKTIETLKALLDSTDSVLGFVSSKDKKEIQDISALRSKCVGLLGNMDGDKKPIPFIEDTAVPPEHLADYIADFKNLLQSHGLEYGCFGHADAGCMHVRPALDLKGDKDRLLFRTLTDEVVTLVKKYGGVLWGEHGKGLRGEYTQSLCGSAYYEKMCAVKAHFDPFNKFNPGKIAVSGEGALIGILDAPLRADFDKDITAKDKAVFPKATQCNGNGQCFSAMPDDTMCPSYKITGDRVHSPKGRAALLREWLRLRGVNKRAARQFAPEVFTSLKGCLSCKACTSTCPIHVNIPDMKAEFLYRYRKQDLRDYMIGLSERMTFWNVFRPASAFGLKDIPKAARPSLKSLMQENGFDFYTEENLKNSVNPVLIVQDAYTSGYEPLLVLSVLEVMRKCGYTPLVLPFRESGKSWHVRGFLKTFKKIALRNIAYFENLKMHGVPLVGIDPSITLVYRDEYKDFLGKKPRFKILHLHEFMQRVVSRTDLPKIKTIPKNCYSLFAHCTEKTAMPDSQQAWATLLKAFDINVEFIATGCCGMAGAYGHEAEHIQNSKGLYDLSWRGKVNRDSLVTGFSCRSQIKRCEDFEAKHPLELLNEMLS